MGKERISLEINSEPMARLRAAGLDPQVYIERMLKRKVLEGETAKQREARWAQWRLENRAELESYDRFIAESGLWCEGYDLR